MTARPRLLIVGRTRYRLPLDEPLERKFAALEETLDVRVVGTAQAGSALATPMFRLVPGRRPSFLDGALFYLALPRLVAAELERFRPDVVLTQSVYEATAALLAKAYMRSRARVVVDVHGDWDTATRLYGSPLRRFLSPVTTRVSRGALRRADAVRTISEFTSGLVRREGIEPASVFPAYVDLSTFVERDPQPLPAAPRAVFVGVLERYKNVDGLVAAWPEVARRVPDARLLVVGSGREQSFVEAFVREHPDTVTWEPRLPQAQVAAALDDSTCLVLPSRSEGLPRIVIEAFCRGRAVVGTRAGGIPDIVRDGENGLLVDNGTPAAIAEALVRILAGRELAERLARGARESATDWLQTPEQYAARIHELVTRVAAA
jgi:glycosyltransferase involved in cell wall biosynthesis